MEFSVMFHLSINFASDVSLKMIKKRRHWLFSREN